jgi:hypothetical protein
MNLVKSVLLLNDFGSITANTQIMAIALNSHKQGGAI